MVVGMHDGAPGVLARQDGRDARLSIENQIIPSRSWLLLAFECLDIRQGFEATSGKYLVELIQ